jgi:hypothetical protein
MSIPSGNSIGEWARGNDWFQLGLFAVLSVFAVVLLARHRSPWKIAFSILLTTGPLIEMVLAHLFRKENHYRITRHAVDRLTSVYLMLMCLFFLLADN